MPTGIDIIAKERTRQIHVEEWTPSHDSEHDGGELAMAASVYAAPEMCRGPARMRAMWPWSDAWWKPSPEDRVRELAKAGALIAAEIDRLLGDE